MLFKLVLRWKEYRNQVKKDLETGTEKTRLLLQLNIEMRKVQSVVFVFLRLQFDQLEEFLRAESQDAL